MRSLIPRSASRALAVAVLAVTTIVPVYARSAGENVPPAYVTVEGEQLSYKDVIELTVLSLDAIGIASGALPKPPDQMPKETPYYYYAGKELTGKPIIWVSSAIAGKTSPPASVTAEIQREAEAASLLAMLDLGKGLPKLHAIFEKVRTDNRRVAALGPELADAMKEMSEKTVAYSETNRHWIFANIQAGTPGVRVYEMLNAHGLGATAASGKQQDAAQTPIVVSLPGSFTPGCYFSRNVIITLDRSERVYKIDLSQPIPNCL